MIVPSTTWMFAAAACALACAVTAGIWLKIKKVRYDELKRQESIAEYAAAEVELYAAVRGGDANRVRRARQRMCAAKDAKQHYCVG